MYLSKNPHQPYCSNTFSHGEMASENFWQFIFKEKIICARHYAE
jgi:hypothetical protein